MKYKPGDKFIIEIEDIYQAANDDSNPIDPTPFELARIKGFNSLVFDEKGLNKLEKYKGQVDDICIGDEVRCNSAPYVKFVVTNIDKGLIYGIRQNGMVITTPMANSTKTGYHTDNISEYLDLNINI